MSSDRIEVVIGADNSAARKALNDTEAQLQRLARATSVAAKSISITGNRLAALSTAQQLGASSAAEMAASQDRAMKAARDLAGGLGAVNQKLVAMGQARQHAAAVTGEVQKLAGGMLRVGAAGLAVQAGLGAVFASSAVDLAIQRDTVERSLAAIAGSATEAQRQLEELKQIAAGPGVDFGPAAAGLMQLTAVGMDADLALRAIREFGNAAAFSTDPANAFTSSLRGLAQIMGKGKISAEELNQQILEGSPMLRQALDTAFGTSNAESIAAMGLSMDEFARRFIGAASSLTRAPESAQNAVQNLKIAFEEAKIAFGKGLLGLSAQDDIKALTQKIEELTPTLHKLGEDLRPLAEQGVRLAGWLLDSEKASSKFARMVLLVGPAGITAAGGLLQLVSSLINLNVSRKLANLGLDHETAALERNTAAKARNAAVDKVGGLRGLFRGRGAKAAAAGPLPLPDLDAGIDAWDAYRASQGKALQGAAQGATKAGLLRGALAGIRSAASWAGKALMGLNPVTLFVVGTTAALTLEYRLMGVGKAFDAVKESAKRAGEQIDDALSRGYLSAEEAERQKQEAKPKGFWRTLFTDWEDMETAAPQVQKAAAGKSVREEVAGAAQPATKRTSSSGPTADALAQKTDRQSGLAAEQAAAAGERLEYAQATGAAEEEIARLQKEQQEAVEASWKAKLAAAEAAKKAGGDEESYQKALLGVEREKLQYARQRWQQDQQAAVKRAQQASELAAGELGVARARITYAKAAGTYEADRSKLVAAEAAAQEAVWEKRLASAASEAKLANDTTILKREQLAIEADRLQVAAERIQQEREEEVRRTQRAAGLRQGDLDLAGARLEAAKATGASEAALLALQRQQRMIQEDVWQKRLAAAAAEAKLANDTTILQREQTNIAKERLELAAREAEQARAAAAARREAAAALTDAQATMVRSRVGLGWELGAEGRRAFGYSEEQFAADQRLQQAFAVRQARQKLESALASIQQPNSTAGQQQARAALLAYQTEVALANREEIDGYLRRREANRKLADEQLAAADAQLAAAQREGAGVEALTRLWQVKLDLHRRIWSEQDAAAKNEDQRNRNTAASVAQQIRQQRELADLQRQQTEQLKGAALDAARERVERAEAYVARLETYEGLQDTKKRAAAAVAEAKLALAGLLAKSGDTLEAYKVETDVLAEKQKKRDKRGDTALLSAVMGGDMGRIADIMQTGHRLGGGIDGLINALNDRRGADVTKLLVEALDQLEDGIFRRLAHAINAKGRVI